MKQNKTEYDKKILQSEIDSSQKPKLLHPAICMNIEDSSEIKKITEALSRWQIHLLNKSVEQIIKIHGDDSTDYRTGFGRGG